MLTICEAPWIDYLEFDDETHQRTLREDTPQEIREMYEKYCEKQREMMEAGEDIPK